MLQALCIYLKLIKVSFQSRMQYRADFITGVINVIVLNIANLGLIGIIFSSFRHLNGWTIWEIVFLYSFWMLGHSIYSLFFWHFNQMEDYILQGQFDQFLLRPVSPLIQFLGREIHYMGIGDMFIGVVGISIAYTRLLLDWSVLDSIFFCITIMSGTIVEMSLSWIIASLSFWTGRSSTAYNVLIRFNEMVHEYPIDIFSKWFRIVVTGLIPVAFINYYPSLVLLRKTDYLGNWYWLSYLSPIVAILFLIAASGIWMLALKRYSSSGN